MLTGKQKQQLKALGNSIDHRYLFGKGDVDQAFLKQIEDALEAHELIKVGLLQNSSIETKEIGNILSKELNCEIVQLIGRVILIYRKSKKNPRITLQ